MFLKIAVKKGSNLEARTNSRLGFIFYECIPNVVFYATYPRRYCKMNNKSILNKKRKYEYG